MTKNARCGQVNTVKLSPKYKQTTKRRLLSFFFTLHLKRVIKILKRSTVNHLLSNRRLKKMLAKYSGFPLFEENKNILHVLKFKTRRIKIEAPFQSWPSGSATAFCTDDWTQSTTDSWCDFSWLTGTEAQLGTEPGHNLVVRTERARCQALSDCRRQKQPCSGVERMVPFAGLSQHWRLNETTGNPWICPRSFSEMLPSF